MEYTGRYTKQLHNIVKKELWYLLCTKLALSHENKDESKKLTKIINTK